ncbi:hypothetical protein ACWEFJ_36880 [Actinosynnema sp. NPDC004786]
MEPEQSSSSVHNIVSGRVDGSVTMAHTIDRIVHGLSWRRLVLIVLAVVLLGCAGLALAGYAVYRVAGSVPQTTVVSILPAVPSTSAPVSATAPGTATATSAAIGSGEAVRAERLVATANHPAVTTTVPVEVTTSVPPVTTSSQSTPTTTTAAEHCSSPQSGNGVWWPSRVC